MTDPGSIPGPELPPTVRALFEAHCAEQLARKDRGQTWRIDGPASPRWVPCPFCGAAAGELCDAQPGATRHGWHFARERANVARMSEAQRQ